MGNPKQPGSNEKIAATIRKVLTGDPHQQLIDPGLNLVMEMSTDALRQINELTRERNELRQERDALRGITQKILHWAVSRCPCENEQPDPCPLCGATVKEGACKAVEAIFPEQLLTDLRDTLARQEKP